MTAGRQFPFMPEPIAALAIERHTKAGDLVLDLDCGDGVLLVRALHAGRHTIGLAWGARCWRMARARVNAAKRGGAWPDATVLDIGRDGAVWPEELASAGRRVDLIITALRPERPAARAAPARLIARASPLLRPGGHLIIATPTRPGPPDDLHRLILAALRAGLLLVSRDHVRLAATRWELLTFRAAPTVGAGALERVEEHQDLVSVVAVGQAECARPSADLAPAEAAVEVLQPHAAAHGQVKLAQFHLVAGDVAGVAHQAHADATASEPGVGLQVADRAPVRDERVGLPGEADPAGHNAVKAGDDQPRTLGREPVQQAVQDGRDVGGVNRREREPGRAAGVADLDPAVQERRPHSQPDVILPERLSQDEVAVGSAHAGQTVTPRFTMPWLSDQRATSRVYADELVTLLAGDALDVLSTMPTGLADCVVTSPPYWGLRDYGTGMWTSGTAGCAHRLAAATRRCALCGATRVDRQLGLEATPEQYVEALRRVFGEVRRVLSDTGTLWLDLGDRHNGPGDALPTKNLLGLPWRVAFALQADGWIIRNAIVWHKPNAMPESVRDRLSARHELLFLLVKQSRYHFDLDAIREPLARPEALDEQISIGGTGKGPHGAVGASARRRGSSRYGGKHHHHRPECRQRGPGAALQPTGRRHNAAHPLGRNPGDVWSISTRPLREAHFAAFPIDVPLRCVAAGCPPGGLVLDPFSGAGTTGLAARQLDRRYLGIDLNPDFHHIALRRLGLEAQGPGQNSAA